MTDDPPRTVGDLDPDREVHVSRRSARTTGVKAHLDADCSLVGETKSKAARQLFDDTDLCQYCLNEAPLGGASIRDGPDARNPSELAETHD